ncbi:LysR family transcriptional regulator [Burkholderia glumae]|uniref:LysR family transcriptional regulator n=1 Tax=Burkholderia glumae TaxID=337 RepID=A0AAP9XW67_BURGL|nr:LysR family transcriptional regulator [Burkholderia glumae]PJO21444.1 LysR family transcriptional regulator [Burkholderia glumae AU6208]NVE25529.1 LysR family transcriptional regulator [Burkholderia glumae]PNL06497.1 LysR family transcriptional regulator [Burkholderia glumae]QGA41396.1 LysR family transcriptional regulator [Burkholderia glumae]
MAITLTAWYASIASPSGIPERHQLNKTNAPDLNLLIVLDALLSENSVARAAKALGLSSSALSRSLARLRATTGDQLLVRAGRDLVPTPRALELRAQVRALVDGAHAVLCPCNSADLGELERTFSIRANEGFVDTFGAELIALVTATAPNVRLRFAPKPDKNVEALRTGAVDLEVGVVGHTGPELRVQALFRDRFIGVVRADHPLAGEHVTPHRYASFGHISVSRRGQVSGPIDNLLETLRLQRTVAAVVSSFPAALSLARDSNLIANVPERQTRKSRGGMLSFTLPVLTTTLTISQIWHPRFDNDPAHRWLRSCLRLVCANQESSLYDVGAAEP